MREDFLTTKTLLTGVIIALLLAGLLFLISRDSDGDKQKYDFVEHYCDSVKINFDDSYDINSLIPRKTGNIGGIIDKKSRNLLARNSMLMNKNGKVINRYEGKVSAGGFSLMVTPDEHTSSIYTFIIKRESPEDYYKIEMSTGTDSKVTITQSTKSKISIIDEFELSLVFNEKNGIRIIFFADYLVILDDRKVLFQQKDISLAKEGRVSFSYKNRANNPEFDVRFAPITKKWQAGVLNQLQKSNIDLADHKFNHTEGTWNGLFSEHLLSLNGKETEVLRRLKLGKTTKKAIYFRLNSSLEYNLFIPDGSSLEMHLSAVPAFITKPKRLNFTVEIESDDDGELREKYVFNFGEFPLKERSFKSFVPDISKFYNRRCSVRFKAETVDKEIIESEDKIILVCASPALYSKRNKDDVNVLLILLDTLRADHLSCYGYTRKTSPNINRFASGSVRFSHAAANSSWTLTSHMSMFTSLYPWETGYFKSKKYSDNVRFARNISTLPELLSKSGYKTAALTGGAYLSSVYGYDRGFDSYFEDPRDMAEITDMAIQWMDKAKTNKFFLFFHTYEIHEPYRHEHFLKTVDKNNRTQAEMAIARYDSGILYADRQIERLLSWLKENDLYDNTLVILTSDHGESFKRLKRDSLGNYAGTHGFTLYNRVIHVPLIIGGAAPFNKGTVCSSQVSLVDIMPTVLELCSVSFDSFSRGQSLASEGILTNENNKRLVYSEGTVGVWERKALRSNTYKLIESTKVWGKGKKERLELYKYDTDIDERKNLRRNEKGIFSTFHQRLKKILKSIAANNRKLVKSETGKGIDTKELESLIRDLGYLND